LKYEQKALKDWLLF